MHGTLKNERGVALITALILLVLLTLLGTAGIMTSTTEIRIGKNYNMGVDTFYDAEGGRARAEDWISANVGIGAPNTPFTDYGTGFYDSQAADLDLSALSWDGQDSIQADASTRYTLEYLGETTVQAVGTPGLSLGVGGGQGSEEIRYHYRVSARSTSGKGVSTVQSTYAIR